MECKRPGCGEAENRINGYCSNYCEDMHDMESQLAAAVAAKEQAERADAFHVEACAAHQAHIDELIADRDRLAGEVARKDVALEDIKHGDDTAPETMRRRASLALAQPAQGAQGEAPADAKGGEE